MSDIRDYLGQGVEHRRTCAELAAMRGVNERNIRELIRRARKSGDKIISSMDPSCCGYWLAATDEEWLAFLDQYRRRAVTSLWLASVGLRASGKLDGQQRIMVGEGAELADECQS